MLNELIGSVVQVLLFAAVPFLVWFLTARKAGSKGTEESKDTFFSWIGLKKPVCENAGKTILLTVAATLLYIGTTIFSIKILPEGVTTAGAQFAGQGAVAIPSVIFYAFLLLTLMPGLFGWYEGWLNEKRCGGSIVPSWLLHGCVNFVTGILSLL